MSDEHKSENEDVEAHGLQGGGSGGIGGLDGRFGATDEDDESDDVQAHKLA